MKKRVAVYTRVSTDLEEQKKSLVVQKEFYKQYCEEKGYELVDEGIYADVGSATSVRQRPYFIQMMEDAGLDYERNNAGTDIFRLSKRDPMFDMIIVKDASRFSRNQEIGWAVTRQLKSKDVEVLFENAGMSSFDSNANFNIPLLFMIAENESEGLSQKISFTKRYNAEQLIYNPARLPYGYARDENNERVIVEDQAKVVRFIHDNYPEQGSHILSRRLNEKGILTQQGKKWSGDKITRIIQQSIYYGVATVGKSKKLNVTDTERVDVPEKEWQTIPNAVPPIITYEQYVENNKIRESRINRSTRRGRRPAINNIYQGKLYCGLCGSRFVRHVGAKDKINYICQNRRKGLGCKVRGISIGIVNDMISRVDVSSLSNEMGNYAYYNTLMKQLNSESRNLQKRIDDYTAQIEALEAENETINRGIIEQFSEGSKNVIKNLSKTMDENTARIDKLTQQRSRINIEAIHSIREKVDEKKKLIEEIKNSQSIKQDEKLKLLKAVTVSDYELNIELHLPSFKEEVEEFNSIFTEAAIKTDIGFKSFDQRFRREHKEAREYWHEVDEARRESQEYYQNYP